MIEPRQVHAAECDACGTTRYSEVGGEDIIGLSGPVSEVDAGGSRAATWFSCKPTVNHIGRAVRNALAREQEEYDRKADYGEEAP